MLLVEQWKDIFEWRRNTKVVLFLVLPIVRFSNRITHIFNNDLDVRSKGKQVQTKMLPQYSIHIERFTSLNSIQTTFGAFPMISHFALKFVFIFVFVFGCHGKPLTQIVQTKCDNNLNKHIYYWKWEIDAIARIQAIGIAEMNRKHKI